MNLESESSINLTIWSAVQEMFGDVYLDPEPKLFLVREVDETFPAQSELASKFEYLLELKGLIPPDRMSIQIMGRLAGHAGTEENEKIGKWGMAFCFNNWQVLVQKDKEILLKKNEFSNIFEPQETFIRRRGRKINKILKWPAIPANKTKALVYPGRGSRTFLKEPNYLCVLIWMFWDNYPTNKPVNYSGLENILERKEAEDPLNKYLDLGIDINRPVKEGEEVNEKDIVNVNGFDLQNKPINLRFHKLPETFEL